MSMERMTRVEEVCRGRRRDWAEFVSLISKSIHQKCVVFCFVAVTAQFRSRNLYLANVFHPISCMFTLSMLKSVNFPFSPRKLTISLKSSLETPTGDRVLVGKLWRSRQINRTPFLAEFAKGCET